MTTVQWSGGQEHWTNKGDTRLFLWRKPAASQAVPAGTILFVHGSSMASQPTFDLHVPGRPHSSVMDWFAERGFDTWCMDNEGYGRSDKHRPINFDISNGADDLAAGRLAAPWGFVESPARLSFWVAQGKADRRAEQLLRWLEAELKS